MVTIERVGYRKASKVLATIVCWWTTHHELGRAPTVEEYAEDWGISRATAYREQATFREAWPEVENPSVLAAACGFNPATDSIPAPMVMGLPAGLLGEA